MIAVARRSEAPVSRIAKDFGISESCLQRWLKIADVEEGEDPGSPKRTQPSSAKRRNVSACWSKRTRFFVERRRISRRRHSPNEVPAGP